MGINYTTREAVKSATDIATTARVDSQIDANIGAASRLVDGFLQYPNGFAPVLATKYFDRPAELSRPRSWRLWLDANEIISLTSLTVGSTAVTASSVFLEPVNYGPPYDSIEIDLSSDFDFSHSAETHQRAITVVGLFGHTDDSAAAGTITANATAAATTITVDSPAAMGVGSLLRINDERMTVTGRSFADTTITTSGALTLDHSDQTLPVSDGTAFAIGETILVDSERMRVDVIAGNTLTVTREFDGSTLATHTTTTAVWAERTVTVERGAAGTTATTHTTADTISVWVPPAAIANLAKEWALSTFYDENAGMAATAGSGEGAAELNATALGRAKTAARTLHGRKMRQR